MKFCLPSGLCVIINILIHTSLFSQTPPGDDVILKAMQDELDHNMKELVLPNYDKPFFMMYGVLDQKQYSFAGMLGSLMQSNESKQRLKTSTRILVGDYSFNDESLEDNLFSSPTAIEIELPLEDDYYGVRRAFWSTTDKVYRDAARHVQKHRETLKETGKPLADIPHRWFARSEAVQMISLLQPSDIDKAHLENLVKNLSTHFVNHPSILNSAVVIHYVEGYKYLVSSEGTKAKIPFQQAEFMTLAQLKNEEGEFSMERIVHHAGTISQLPNEQQLAMEIDAMIDRIEKQSGMPKFTEEYTGPVLFTGNAVAELFSSMLLRGRESIFANDNIARLKGYQYDKEAGSMESKLGKSVVHESITLKARPRLKSYKGVELMGSFDIDTEGVVPADELVIIDKGILKELLNNRTMTSLIQKSNGFSGGPGVLEVVVAQKSSDKILKEKLIAQAKKEGLDYAFIVRDDNGLGMGLLNVYKVSVTDGKEELLRNAIINGTTLKNFKHILGASENYQAYNVGSNGRYDRGPDFGMVSYIVPESILIEEMEIKPFTMPSLKEEEFVSNPLKK